LKVKKVLTEFFTLRNVNVKKCILFLTWPCRTYLRLIRYQCVNVFCLVFCKISINHHIKVLIEISDVITAVPSKERLQKSSLRSLQKGVTKSYFWRENIGANKLLGGFPEGVG
jgi:hypothetical protein